MRLTRPPTIPETLPRDWRNLLASMTEVDSARRPSSAQLAKALRGIARGMDATTATIALRSVQPSTRPLTKPLSQQLPPVVTPDRGLARPRPAKRAERAKQAALTARARDRLLWVIGAAAALLLIVGAVLVFSGHRSPTSKTPPQNTGVPAKVSTDLQHLHEAVSGG